MTSRVIVLVIILLVASFLPGTVRGASTVTENMTITISPSTAPIDSYNPVTSGLVGYWPFDEGTGTSAFDLTGKGNTGTLTNSPAWVSGKFGQALSMSVTGNKYVSLAESSGLDLNGATGLSICAWINPSNPSSPSNQRIVEDIASIAGHLQGYNLDFNGGQYRMEVFNSAGADDAISIGTLPTSNVWSQICGTWTASNSMVLYTNGVSIGSATASNSALAGSGVGLAIGASNGGGGTNNLNGILDDVRIYNRALSASEIFSLFGSAIPPEQLFTFVGCAPSIPGIPGDGNQYTFTANASCNLLINSPTPWAPYTNGYMFAAGASYGNQYMFQTAATGSETNSLTVYYGVQPVSGAGGQSWTCSANATSCQATGSVAPPSVGFLPILLAATVGLGAVAIMRGRKRR